MKWVAEMSDILYIRRRSYTKFFFIKKEHQPIGRAIFSAHPRCHRWSLSELYFMYLHYFCNPICWSHECKFLFDAISRESDATFLCIALVKYEKFMFWVVHEQKISKTGRQAKNLLNFSMQFCENKSSKITVKPILLLFSSLLNQTESHQSPSASSPRVFAVGFFSFLIFVRFLSDSFLMFYVWT